MPLTSYYPHTVTTKDIQRSYRKVFNLAKKHGAVVVMTRNKPDVVILSLAEVERIYSLTHLKQLDEVIDFLKAHQRKEKNRKLLEFALNVDL